MNDTNTKELTTQGFLEKYKAQIAAALPKHMTVERVMRIVFSELRKTPRLGECDPKSLLSSVIQASLLGLNIGGIIGECYLVPFKKECQFILGYKGMLALAYRNLKVKSVAAHCVYANDFFEFEYGANPYLRHSPNIEGPRGALKCVYAVCILDGNNPLFEVLSLEDVNKAKSQSKTSNFGPWVNHFDEMAMKTAIRRLFKYMPISIELQTAIALDEAADDGRQGEVIEHDLNIGTEEEEGKTKSDEISDILG